MIKTILLFTLSIISQTAYAQSVESPLIRKVLSELNLQENDVNLELVCEKILPYSKDKSVIVIPEYSANRKDEYDEHYFELNAHILIVENLTGKIVSKFYEPNAWTSDAVMLTSIEIDTGLYNLNLETRAFGIRVNYTGSSRPNPYGQTDLSLYYVKKSSLKQVLKNYPIYDFHGEWDTNCIGEFEGKESILVIDKLKTNNFFDLVINTKIVKTENLLTDDDCIEKIKTSKRVLKLKYNGKEYK